MLYSHVGITMLSLLVNIFRKYNQMNFEGAGVLMVNSTHLILKLAVNSTYTDSFV